jgi:hypothetical protein
MEELTEKLLEKVLDMVNQEVKYTQKKFQDNKNKKIGEDTEINELK